MKLFTIKLELHFNVVHKKSILEIKLPSINAYFIVISIHFNDS